MSIWLGNKRLDGGSARNIGDIFYTTRTDSGLGGAVECNGGTYSTADYTGAGSIGELLAGGKLDYISLTDYETAISTKGYCDKIGWDGTGTTSFRVPKLAPKRYVIKEQKPTADNNYKWYRLYNDGWVEQGGRTSTNGVISATNKRISLPIIMANRNYTVAVFENANSGNTTMTVGWESTNSFSLGSVTGSSTGTVCWQVSGQSAIVSDPTERAMFQLFNGTTDEAVATVGTVVADVSNLKDMSNITATGKEVIAHQAMPSSRYIDLTLGASGTEYTALGTGYILVCKQSSGASQNINIQKKIAGTYTLWDIKWASASTFNLVVSMPVVAGEKFIINYTTGNATQFFMFVPAVGA